jgi:predicted Zn-dependent protease
VLNNLAWSYYQIRDPRALPTAEQAHKLKPDNAAVADTLGTILTEQGDTKRGLELLQKATAAAPKVPQIRYHLARGLAKAGEKSRARDELERLLAAHTEFAERDDAVKLLKQLRN